MFYVPTLQQLTIPTNIKILLQSTPITLKQSRNNVKIKFFKSSPKYIEQNVRKNKSIKTEPRGSSIKQINKTLKQKQKLEQRQKLPHIRLDQTLKLGVKGIMATKQLMPYLRKAHQCNYKFVRNRQKYQRLKSQSQYYCKSQRNHIDIQKYSSVKNQRNTQIKVERDELKIKAAFFCQQLKNDAHKISPWQVHGPTLNNFYQF